MITKEQCRGARAMLGLSREHLAKAAKVGHRTLVDFERGARQPYDRTIADIQAALEKSGVEFIAADEEKGPGLRLRQPAE